MALGLWGEGVYNPTTEDTSNGREKQKQPAIKGGVCGRKEMGLTCWRRRAISCQVIDEKMKSYLAKIMEKYRS